MRCGPPIGQFFSVLILKAAIKTTSRLSAPILLAWVDKNIYTIRKQIYPTPGRGPNANLHYGQQTNNSDSIGEQAADPPEKGC